MLNICVIRPDGYPHHHAFDELVELIQVSLQKLGFHCSETANAVKLDCRNIIVGSHLLGQGREISIPTNSIILNTEPLFSAENPAWTEVVLSYARKHEVWDYNQRNILSLERHGVTGARLLRIGYEPELARIPRAREQDIDVLFYGSCNERRERVLRNLEERGLNVVRLFGVYGRDRDELISRSKVILNMHYYDQRIFEVVRAFYLMTNSKAVVAEIGADTSVETRFLSGLKGVPYDQLAEACHSLVRNNDLRQSLEEQALFIISQWPQHELMRGHCTYPRC